MSFHLTHPAPIPVVKKVLEKDIENYLRKRVLAIGGECYKWSSQNVRGVADRVVVSPSGQVWFVEVKRKGGRFSKLQLRFKERMAALGMSRYIVVWSKDDVNKFVGIL